MRVTAVHRIVRSHAASRCLGFARSQRRLGQGRRRAALAGSFVGAIAAFWAASAASCDSASAQVTGLSAVIEAPARVEVGDRFTLAVRYAADPNTPAGQHGSSLLAGLYVGAVCPQPSEPALLEVTSSYGVPFGAQEQRVKATAAEDLEVGEYSVCAYVISDSEPPALVSRAALLVQPVRPTAERPWTITTSRYSVQLVGPLFFGRVSMPRLDFYYGQPSRHRSRQGGCRATWSDVGVTATFYNLGVGSGPCGEDGRIDTFSIGGAQQYGLVRTSAGLKLGDPVAQVRQHYKHAHGHGAHTWWLRSAHSNVAGGFRYPVLSAQERRGRITHFLGFIGGAGE